MKAGGQSAIAILRETMEYNVLLMNRLFMVQFTASGTQSYQMQWLKVSLVLSFEAILSIFITFRPKHVGFADQFHHHRGGLNRFR